MVVRLKLVTVAVEEDGCSSVLVWDRRPVAVALERTFENRRVIIPNGYHRCTRSFYNKGGYFTFEVFVAGHDRILFHKGAIEDHSTGCILVGKSFGVVDGKVAILNTGDGLAEFLRLTDGITEFDMEVTGR